MSLGNILYRTGLVRKEQIEDVDESLETESAVSEERVQQLEDRVSALEAESEEQGGEE